MSESSAGFSPLTPGLWGVLATPFDDGGRHVDTSSLRAQVQLYRDLGAAGVVALGVFGEGASLDRDEQRLVVETVRSQAPDTPLVIGLATLATAPAVEQAADLVAAAGSPLAAIMLQANSGDADVLARHLSTVHESVGAPIVLQDYPVASGVRVSDAVVLETVLRVPSVVAVKSEAPPTAAAIAALAPHTRASVFGGLGGAGLLDELAAGAAGVMTGFSHPEGLRSVLDAWEHGGARAAHEAFRPWLPLVNFEAQPGIGLAVRKQILARRGLIADPAVRPPAAPFPEALRPMLRTHLDNVVHLSHNGI